jgi:hypothetical protein
VVNFIRSLPTAEFLFTDFNALETSVRVTISKLSKRPCNGVTKSSLIYGSGADGSGNKNRHSFPHLSSKSDEPSSSGIAFECAIVWRLVIDYMEERDACSSLFFQ